MRRLLAKYVAPVFEKKIDRTTYAIFQIGGLSTKSAIKSHKYKPKANKYVLIESFLV